MLKAYAKTQERRQLSAIKNLLRFFLDADGHVLT